MGMGVDAGEFRSRVVVFGVVGFGVAACKPVSAGLAAFEHVVVGCSIALGSGVAVCVELAWSAVSGVAVSGGERSEPAARAAACAGSRVRIRSSPAESWGCHADRPCPAGRSGHPEQLIDRPRSGLSVHAHYAIYVPCSGPCVHAIRTPRPIHPAHSDHAAHSPRAPCTATHATRGGRRRRGHGRAGGPNRAALDVSRTARTHRSAAHAPASEPPSSLLAS